MTFSNLSDLAFSTLCTTRNTSGVELWEIRAAIRKIGTALDAAPRKYPAQNCWQAAQIHLNGCEVLVEQVTRKDHSRGYCLTWVRKNGQDIAFYNV